MKTGKNPDYPVHPVKKLPCHLVAGPLRFFGVRDVELIEDAKAQMFDQIVDRFRTVIKTGAGGQDLSTGVRKPQHIFEMDGIVGRFTRDEEQLAAFF